MAIPLQGWYALNVILNVWSALNNPTTARSANLGELTGHFCWQIIFPAKTPVQKECLATKP